MYPLTLVKYAERPEHSRFVSKTFPIVFTQCKKAKGGGFLCMPNLIGYMPIPLYGGALFVWLKIKAKEKASLEESAISKIV